MKGREYLILTASGPQQWTERGKVEAHGPEQAIKKAAREEIVATGVQVAAIPLRNWAVGTPSVKKREPVIELEMAENGQLTVEDVLDAAEKDGLVTTPAS